MKAKITTVACVAALLLSSGLLTAAPKIPTGKCQNMHFEDGSTARAKTTSSGWTRCDYNFELRVKAGLKATNGRPYAIRTVTPDRCYVWVAEKAIRYDAIDQAWSACVNRSRQLAEAETN